MNYSISFSTPAISTGFDWQLFQEAMVTDESGKMIAKAEFEILTLNKDRDAKKSYKMLDEQGATDWEVPLNIYFSKQNLTDALCEQLAVKSDKKSKQHLLLEAISVLPEHRGKGLAKTLIEAIAKEYGKAQSISVLSLPLHLFVDSDNCETEQDKVFYEALDLTNDSATREQTDGFFNHLGFFEISIDEDKLEQTLPYTVFVTSPKKQLPA